MESLYRQALFSIGGKMSESDIILDAMEATVNKIARKLPFDRTFIGVVTKVLGDNAYLIRYDDAERKFKTKHALRLKVGDMVQVTYPQNQISKKFIVGDIQPNEVDLIRRGVDVVTFSQNTLITTQIDNSYGSYPFSIASYGHQAATGMPFNSSFWGYVWGYDPNYTTVIAIPANNAYDLPGYHEMYILKKDQGKWGEWKALVSQNAKALNYEPMSIEDNKKVNTLNTITANGTLNKSILISGTCTFGKCGNIVTFRWDGNIDFDNLPKIGDTVLISGLPTSPIQNFICDFEILDATNKNGTFPIFMDGNITMNNNANLTGTKYAYISGTYACS